MENLLKKLSYEGGTIVASSECSDLEIARARCCGTMYVTEGGLGYIWRPPSNDKKNLDIAVSALRDIEMWVHGIEGSDSPEEAAMGMNMRATKALNELA